MTKNNMNHMVNRGLPALEWYSLNQFNTIVREPFSENSPIELKNLSDSDLESIPILNQIRYTLELIDAAGEMKLTQTGNLKRKVVRDIHSQEFFPDRAEMMMEKDDIYKQSDSITIDLTKILLDISTLTKTSHNKYSLTKKGKQILNKPNKLLKNIFKLYCTEYNMSYFDGFHPREIGKMGIGFSLILLSKYGDKSHSAKFYAKKYFEAFPDLLNKVNPTGDSKLKTGTHTYSLRTFTRFLKYFAFIEVEQEKPGEEEYITKTKLYDKFINCKLPKNRE